MIHEHPALRQHNSKKNSRKYVKVSKIELRTFLNRIPDFLWKNMRDNRPPQTSPQETDTAMWGDWESETHLYSNTKRNSLCCDIIIHIHVSISSNCTLF